MKVIGIKVTKHDKRLATYVQIHTDSRDVFARLTPIQARNLAKKILKVCNDLKGASSD